MVGLLFDVEGLTDALKLDVRIGWCRRTDVQDDVVVAAGLDQAVGTHIASVRKAPNGYFITRYTNLSLVSSVLILWQGSTSYGTAALPYRIPFSITMGITSSRLTRKPLLAIIEALKRFLGALIDALIDFLGLLELPASEIEASRE